MKWLCMMLILLPVFARAQEGGEPLPEYQKQMTVTGKIRSTGSSTISNLMARWVESFKRLHPEAEFEITGGGSSTAPPALLAGKCELAPMSRPMNAKEREAFEKQFGHPPTEIRVAVDALAVYVNRDNPIKGLTLAQLDAIYSSTHKRGGKPLRTWGDLGLEGEWSARLVRPVGYDSASTGAYTIFKETVLSGGDFSAELRTYSGSSSIVQAPAAEPEAIAYASAFFKTKRTRIVPISSDGNLVCTPDFCTMS